jgi:hypothetical protein
MSRRGVLECCGVLVLVHDFCRSVYCGQVMGVGTTAERQAASYAVWQRRKGEDGEAAPGCEYASVASALQNKAMLSLESFRVEEVTPDIWQALV